MARGARLDARPGGPPGPGARGAREHQRERIRRLPARRASPAVAGAGRTRGRGARRRALAARAEPLLEPFRELWVVFGLGASTLGPVAYSLGLLQLVQDRPDDAAATFELAIELSLRMRARPYVARSRAGWPTRCGGAARRGEAARAEELSALAAADARELGMSRLQRELGAAVSVR